MKQSFRAISLQVASKLYTLKLTPLRTPPEKASKMYF